MSTRSGVMLMRESLSLHGVGHVLRLPRWAMPESAEGYWHIPRSAELHYDDYGSVRFWCGQHRWMVLSRMTNQTPPTMRCGTCEGRAAGYEAKGDGAIYQPRSAFDAPKLCPWLVRGDKEPLCPYCGAKPSYSRNYGHYDERQHRAGKMIVTVEPCPRHGWKNMRRVDDTLVCRDWGFRPTCDYAAARSSLGEER